MASLKAKVSFPASILEARGLVKLGRLSGEDLDLYSWWSSLAAKLAVSGRMDLVTDMDTDAKREMIQNTFGMPFNLFYLSCIILIFHNTEVRRFAYSGIRREDYEVTS